jgi:hypothetical protein
MRWHSIFLCLTAISVGCGNSDTVQSEDGGSADATQNEAEAAAEGDAEAGGPVYDAATDSSGGDSASPVDSGTTDAASEAAAADAGDDGGPGAVEGGVTVLFQCGPTVTCNAQIQFCLHTTGPLGVDGSTNEMYSCRTIPSQCEPGPTCACLSMTSASQGCPCSVAVGLEVDCYFP